MLMLECHQNAAIGDQTNACRNDQLQSERWRGDHLRRAAYRGLKKDVDFAVRTDANRVKK
jgi:hypothetical protein